MHIRFNSSLGFLFALSLTGCFSDVEQTAAEKVTHPAVQAANEKLGGVSGAWTGTWKGPDGHDHPAHATFTQEGLSVSGTFTFEENPCVRAATLRAAIVDKGLDADLTAGELHLHYAVTYFDGTSMDGELTAIEPALCALGQGGSALVHFTRD